MVEIGVEWIRRLSYVCGCERDRERVHVSQIQTNIRDKCYPERRSFLSAIEKDISQRVIARETYEGTQNISREKECV